MPEIPIHQKYLVMKEKLLAAAVVQKTPPVLAPPVLPPPSLLAPKSAAALAKKPVTLKLYEKHILKGRTATQLEIIYFYSPD